MLSPGTRPSAPRSAQPARRSEMKLPAAGPSPVDIQNHLYLSFLEASTTDVALRVSGSWHAIYKLHKVVLIQSAFFRSLFTAGFLESSPRLSHTTVNEIQIRFDDPNITRAAFEVCISRLYGGGPPLFLPAAFKPTTAHPLTAVFPNPPLPTRPDIPEGHHLATPRFLLSLLATSLFLSIPSVAQQALSFVLNTIGPYTVVQYLNFALGKPIGLTDTELGETEAAVGLESVAHLFHEDDDASSIATSHVQSTKDHDIPSPCNDDSLSEDSHFYSSVFELEHETEDLGMRMHYGGVSDRIGEAATSWLARWAQETLLCEETPPMTSVTRKRAFTMSSIQSSSVSHSPLVKGPSIWGRGGLPADWVKALVSSDSLFVADEFHRFEFAKSVVELRRSQGVSEREEQVWSAMFAEGIHYANLSMSQLLHISNDISPTTKKPFVPLQVVQAAQWHQSVLRHAITYRHPPSLPHSIPSSPVPRDLELGITETTCQIQSRLASGERVTEAERNKPLYRVSGNSSLRIGEPGNAVEPSSISMDDLFALSSSPSKNSTTSDSPPLRSITDESTYFGLLSPATTIEKCSDADPTGSQKWSSYPPYRFAVEFWDIGHLKEMQRLHSQTIWYAGSMFNVYVQVVPKKSGTQVGVYVHRQSNIDPIPRMSSANRPALSQHNRMPSLPALVGPTPSTPVRPSLTPTRSTTPSSASRPGSSSSLPSSSPLSGPDIRAEGGSFDRVSNTLPATVPGVSPPDQPYRDPRPVLKAYFMVHCSSPNGNAQTRFASSPDEFKVSQSWGWKSSSLWTGKSDEPASKEVSLRATVVLGLV